MSRVHKHCQNTDSDLNLPRRIEAKNDDAKVLWEVKLVYMFHQKKVKGHNLTHNSTYRLTNNIRAIQSRVDLELKGGLAKYRNV